MTVVNSHVENPARPGRAAVRALAVGAAPIVGAGVASVLRVEFGRDVRTAITDCEAGWVALGAMPEDWRRVVRAALHRRPRALEARAGEGKGEAFRVPATLRRRPALAITALLTPRQREAFHLLCLGFANKAIAERLGLSVGTVKLHVVAILRALRIKRRVDFVLHRTGVERPQGEARLDASGVVAARYEDLGAGESEKE